MGGYKTQARPRANHHTEVGIDLVAMCVNDLVVQGAEPLFFLDYFATGKLDPSAAGQVVEGIAQGCQQAGCALLGAKPLKCPACMRRRLRSCRICRRRGGTGGLLPRQDLVNNDVIIGWPRRASFEWVFPCAEIVEREGLSLTIPRHSTPKENSAGTSAQPFSYPPGFM